jgi:hypothetical protein
MKLARTLGLRLTPYVLEAGWLRDGERARLRVTAAQAAIAVLAAGLAVGREPFYRGEGDDRPEVKPVWLSRNSVFEALAAGWSDWFRQAPAQRIVDLRRDTMTAVRRDLLRNGLDFAALWTLARNNSLYSARRQGEVEDVGGYTVTIKDQTKVDEFLRALDDAGYPLRRYGQRLLLADAPTGNDIADRPLRSEIAAEWPYNTVDLSPRSHEVIRALEGARLQFHVATFRTDFRALRARADTLTQQFEATYRAGTHTLLRDDDYRRDFFRKLAPARRIRAHRDWANFLKAKGPAVQWDSVARQLVNAPDVVFVRGMFQRLVNRRWDSVDAWAQHASEEYRGRWFAASDGSQLIGLDVAASQTQILTMFLGLRHLEALTSPDFNTWLAELAWTYRSEWLKRGYTGARDPRLRSLVKAVWMQELYGKPAQYVARAQSNDPDTYGPGWIRDTCAQALVKTVPEYPEVAEFLRACRTVADVALGHDPYAGIQFPDPFDGALVRWNPISRHKKIVRPSLLLMLPATCQTHRDVHGRVLGRQFAKHVAPDPGTGDYPVDGETLGRQVAPMLVHTLDAAFAGHVIEGLAHAGIRDIVSIHDCWMVPTAHAAMLAQVISKAGRPWLESLSPLYTMLQRYLKNTAHEDFANRIHARWVARLAQIDNDPVSFVVKPANLTDRPSTPTCLPANIQ